MNWIYNLIFSKWNMTSQKDLILSWNTVAFAIEHLLPKLLYIESTEVLTVFVSMEELDMKLNRLDPGLLLHILFLELDIVCNLMWEMTANIFLLRWLVGSERWLLITRGCLSIFDGYLATDSGIAVRDLSVLRRLGSFNVFQYNHHSTVETSIPDNSYTPQQCWWTVRK